MDLRLGHCKRGELGVTYGTDFLTVTGFSHFGCAHILKMLLPVILNSLVEALSRAPLSPQHMKGKSKQRGGLHDTPPPDGPHFWNLLANLIRHR